MILLVKHWEFIELAVDPIPSSKLAWNPSMAQGQSPQWRANDSEFQDGSWQRIAKGLI